MNAADGEIHCFHLMRHPRGKYMRDNCLLDAGRARGG